MLFAILTVAAMSLKAQTIVIDDGFENGIQDSVWTQEFVRGEQAWAVEDVADGLSYPSTVKQGTKRAYLRNMTGETQGYVTRLVSKVMDLSPTVVYRPYLSFWYANPKWTADRDTLRVLYRTNTHGQWRRLAEYSTAMANWQQAKIELPDVGETYQIAFEGTDNLGRGIVLDSILLRSAPVCSVPQEIMVSNRGQDRVNIAWSASWDATQFEMIVSKDTIDPYDLTEEMEAQLTFHGLVPRFPHNYDLTLEAGEFYLVYIRSICPNEISLWSHELNDGKPHGFRVRTSKQIPYFCDFNYPSTQTRDPEWTWGNNTGKEQPYVNSKQSAAQRAYYSPNGSPAVVFSGTSKTAVVPAGKYVYLATPAISDSLNAAFSLNQCQVHFWSTAYTYTSRQYARSIIVGVMDDPDDLTTFSAVDTVSVWGSATFVESIVDLASYQGQGVYVAFMSDFDLPNHFYIDDVTVEYRPQVNKVTKISVNPRDTFATISWEGNASSYNVLVTNAEVDPANPTETAIIAQATVTTNSYRCEGLGADHSWNKPYYAYVQAVGADWSYRYPFVTIAPKRELEYTIDFEPSSGRYKIGGANSNTYCPTNIGVFTNDAKYPSLSSSNVYKGSGCMFMNKTVGTDAWMTLPMVENLDSTQVKFYLSGNTTYSQAHASIGVMTNPMDINTYTKVADFTLNTTGYMMCYANFRNYHGEPGVIAIVWEDVQGMANNTINYIDEVKVEKLSECVPPLGVALEVEADSVTLSWDASPNFMYEVVISRSALTTTQKDKTFAEIAALSQVVFADTLVWNGDETQTQVYGIGNLRPQTDYYTYIRTVCNGDAAWWTEKSFRTPCQAAAFPYKENFESYNTGVAASQLGCWQIADYLSTSYPIIYNASGDNGKTLELWTSSSHRNVAILPPVEGELSNMMLSFETRSYYTNATSTSVLYVGTMADINNQNTFIPFDTIYNSGGTEFQKVKLVLSDYTLTYDNIAFSSGMGTASSDVLIDNIELRDATCIEAFDFQQTGADAYSVDFTWSGLSSNDEWELRVLNTNLSVANAAAGNYDTAQVAVINDTVITGRTFHVSGLEPVSTYYVYIRVLCGDSIWGKFTIKTACELFDPTKPNKETFESYQGGTSYSENYQVPCWTVGNWGTTSTSYIPYIYNSSSYSNSGTKTYRMYGYSYSDYTPAYIVSPEIDIAHMKELAVSFNMYASTSYWWICGVMTDPNDLSTFVVLDSVKGTGASKQYIYDLSEYEELIPATAKYFAWRTPYGVTSIAYLDDVSIAKMVCPFTKPGYSDLTAQSVRISSGLRTDDEWLLLVTNTYVSPDSLASPTYRVPSSYKVYYDTLDVRSKVVTQLADQTTYYVYTATYCDSTVSQWNSLSFITPCLALKPTTMGTITFSTEEGYITGSGANRYLPCWTIGSKTPGLADNSSYIPYIGTNSSDMHNGHNYLYFYDYVYGTSSNYVGAYAIMPEMSVDSIKKYQVNFWARGSSTSSNNSQIIVGIVSDPSDLNTFVAVDTLNLSHTGYEPYSVGFENYEGDFLGNQGKNIMFLSDFGVTNYAYISEISVDLIPTCRPVSSFSVDSVGEDAAIISWKGYQDSYRLLVADKALTDKEKLNYPYLIDSIVYKSERVRLYDLSPTTNYYVYAQGICSDKDSTEISMQSAVFRTLCPLSTGVPLPFSDDFMSYEVNEVDPGCWIFRGSSYSKIYAVTIGEKTVHAIDLYTTSSGNNGYIVVPALAAPLEDLQVEFDVRTYGGSSTSSAVLHLGTMADPEDPTTYVDFASFPVEGADVHHFELQLGEYNLAHERLVFTSGMTYEGSASDVYFINVALSVASTCHAPKMKVTSAMSNAVELQITPIKAENNQWELVVISDSAYAKIRNIEAYLKTAPKLTVDTVDYTITGLQPATSYYIYARTVCDGADAYSAWSREPLRVHTQFYFRDDYFFGFEKKDELWERSMYSKNDNYYIHPALVTDRDTLGEPSTTYNYYPYSLENTTAALYAHTGAGALVMNASGNYHGAYVIFPAVDEAKARSFEFKIRPAYVSATTMKPGYHSEGVIEIGTVQKNKSFDTYQPMATIRVDKLNTADTAKLDNNWLFQYYTVDLDSATIADRQLVLHSPMQPVLSSTLYIDDVTLGAQKGFSLVALKDIVVNGLDATVTWENIGGPWNLHILDTAGVDVRTYTNLTATSQLVSGLEARTDYKAVLEAVNVPVGTAYTTTASMTFRTTCPVMEPDVTTGNFYWDFNDPYEWEPNDILAGASTDSLYLKPVCFNVGITYPRASNGYQWLVQRKGYDYWSTAIQGDAYANYEIGRNDSPAMRIYTTNTNYNSYLVLPALHCGFDTMMVEFYGRCFVNYDEQHPTTSKRGKIVDAQYLGAGYSQAMVVGTLTDPHDFSTLQVLDTVYYTQTELTTATDVNNDPNGLRYWELMQLPLTGAQGQYVVLFQPAPGLFILDDLSVKPIGNTLFAPSYPHTADVTGTSATLLWTPKHPALSSVIVVLNATGTEELFRDTVAGASHALTNLTPGTSYQWYVYQTDGTNNSPSTPIVQFATECIAVSPAYSCGFEREDGWNFIPGQSVYTQAVCWTYADALQSVWNASYDAQNIANTDAALYSHDGSYAVLMKGSYSSYAASYQPYIAMPAMDIAAYDTLRVSFWMRPAYVNANTGKIGAAYTGSSYSKSVIVGTMTDPTDASTFVAIDTVTYEGMLSTADSASALNNYLFQQKKVNLTGATGQYVAIMTSFREKGGQANKNLDYIFLDDIAFERINECHEPTELKAEKVGGDFAELSWNSESSSFILQVSTDIFFANEDAFVFNDTVDANTYTVTGLANVTSYVWRVQALCDGAFPQSDFSTKANFKTSRSPYFYEPFNTAVNQSEWIFSYSHADNVLDTTVTISRSDNAYGFKRTTSNFGLPTSHYMAMGYMGDFNWMITPEFYLPEEDSVHFSMDLALTACNTNHIATAAAASESDMKDDYYFMIIVSEDGGATWKSENILGKWQNTNAQGQQLRDIPSTGMTVRYSLAAYAGKSIRIGMYREAPTSSNTGIAIHIDNVRLGYFDKVVESAFGCQYEDIQIGDIILPGDETQPGLHIYPQCVYASDEEAQAGAIDTVYSLEIEVFPAQETLQADTICEGETYTDLNFHGKDRTGVYRRKLASVLGCDSTITLNLIVTPRAYAPDLEVEICPGEAYTWHGDTYTRAGIYTDTLQSAAGCDSVTTLIVSYHAAEDTLYDASRVAVSALPFTYQNAAHPYVAGQTPITYPVGTPIGEYKDTVMVQGTSCAAILVHTLTVYDEEGIDNILDGDGNARKIIYKDQLYIICNDEWYNAIGQKVNDPRK